MAFKSYAAQAERPGTLASHAGGSLRAVSRGAANQAQQQQCYLPPGWPSEVDPPAHPDWQASAVGFLLDCCPADYRAYPILRRHPVVLARFAADFVEGQIASSRTALAQARASLSDVVGPQVLDGAVEMLQSEEARLIRVRRSVALVEEALRGKIFLPKL